MSGIKWAQELVKELVLSGTPKEALKSVRTLVGTAWKEEQRHVTAAEAMKVFEQDLEDARVTIGTVDKARSLFLTGKLPEIRDETPIEDIVPPPPTDTESEMVAAGSIPSHDFAPAKSKRKEGA